MTFKFHTDDAHGWLEVSADHLAVAGLHPMQFSQFSYRGRDGTMYLEEDCDAPKFQKAWEEKGRTFDYQIHHLSGQHFIRNMQRNN